MTPAQHVSASQVDVLTVEIEHVDVDALESAAAQFNLDVEPTPHTLRLIQVLEFHTHASACMLDSIDCHLPVLLQQ